MSLPHFPEDALGITCEQAFNMLLGSIAMEEMALSHILNAEGEKVQYVLGTLPGKPHTCATPKEVLEVNRSVSELLDKVAYNQILLKGKLQQVLEAKESHCPPPAPCPPPARACLWTAEKNRPWLCGCPLPWKRTGEPCGELCWQGCSPGLLHLCPGRRYLVSFSLQVLTGRPGPVRVVLQGVHGCGNEIVSVCEAVAAPPCCEAHIAGCAVLTADPARPASCTLQLLLDAPDSVTVKKAVLTIADIS